MHKLYLYMKCCSACECLWAANVVRVMLALTQTETDRETKYWIKYRQKSVLVFCFFRHLNILFIALSTNRMRKTPSTRIENGDRFNFNFRCFCVMHNFHAFHMAWSLYLEYTHKTYSHIYNWIKSKMHIQKR